jgi:hypothetical protein
MDHPFESTVACIDWLFRRNSYGRRRPATGQQFRCGHRTSLPAVRRRKPQPPHRSQLGGVLGHVDGWRRELQIDGAGHLDFTDLGLLLDQLGLDKHVLFPGGFGSIRPTRAIEVQQSYVGAFFTQHLRGRHKRLLDRPSRRFPEVIFVGSSSPRRNDLSAA